LNQIDTWPRPLFQGNARVRKVIFMKSKVKISEQANTEQKEMANCMKDESKDKVRSNSNITPFYQHN
jgi:hypothetical protein